MSNCRNGSFVCWMLQVTILPVIAQKVERARARARARQNCSTYDVAACLPQLAISFCQILSDEFSRQGPVDCWHCGGLA